MRFWPVALPTRSICTRAFTAALAIALLLATQTRSPADAEPKRVMMLHSFGPRFKPWSDYAQTIRSEISRQWRKPVDFLDHSLVNARQDDENSEASFVEYLRTLYISRPVDLIVAIGAPSANFVQRYRQRLFPETPMILTAVEQRRIQFVKLTENDTVVAVAHDFPAAFENILRVLPLTKTIAIVNGASPNEKFWLNEMRRELAPLAGRVELKWYDERSFEDILIDAARLPPYSAIFWHLMNVDAAGVAHETNEALNKLSSSANAPIFSYDGSFFGEAIVGGPMHSVLEFKPDHRCGCHSYPQRRKGRRHQNRPHRIRSAYLRLAADAALGHWREQSARRQHSLFPGANSMGAVLVADRVRQRGYSDTGRAYLDLAARASPATKGRGAGAPAHG